MKLTFSRSNLKVPIFLLAAFLLVLFSGGLFSSSLAKEEKLPELKPMVPKLHKVEPFEAGVEHNQYIQKKKAKKKRKKRRRLKSSAKKSKFKGKTSRGGRLDKGRLDSSIGSNMLESKTKRGIGI